ncbi:MAG: beta-N-acetylhexosaminidase, partial [Clostridia bacterium]|nr:beta-N-acetylhexosaminidase [Clostridia bacterium]
MKLYFDAPPSLSDALLILTEDLGITPAPQDAAEGTVTVNEVPEDILTVTREGCQATLTFGGGRVRFCRGLATVARLFREGVTSYARTERPLFSMNGTMMDVSRNAVLSVPAVKHLLRKLSLLGQNTLMLYTEDTYEIRERPYFGYMRGRYTEAELRELDAYAATLGIEMIPCIQVLGHLVTALRWGVTTPYRDTDRVLLVGADETYALIEDMLKTVSSCFRSRRVHIGMDETHDLGCGASIDRFGYRPSSELYLEHLARVCELCRKHGLSPMMWSDMFFRIYDEEKKCHVLYEPARGVSRELADRIPAGTRLVFWDYYHANYSFYSGNIKNHRLLDKDTVFAGGVWLWSGHSPLFSRSLRNTVPALEACRDEGVREVLSTVWHNGSEAALPLSLAGFAWYADFDYRGEYSEEGVSETFRAACLESYEDFLLAELPEYPHGGRGPLSRALLYNDPLCGLADKTLEKFDGYRAFYEKAEAELAAAVTEGYFAPAFDVLRALVRVLAKKADFGIRLTRAYRAGDRAALAALAAECDEIGTRIEALRLSHRASWMAYCKPFGWEVHDIRYGGLLCRFETAKARLSSYLAGEIPAIEELEAER